MSRSPFWVVSYGVLAALLSAFSAAAQEPEEARSIEQRVAELEQAQQRDDSLWDMVSIHGVLAFGYQAEFSHGPSDPDDPTGWAVPFQPEISITPTEQDEIFFKFGFAAGDGLNAETNFTLAPWAADLASDVVDLSGGSRDHLLTAWYRHDFEFSEDHSLGVVGGIIDATDYLDWNEYSNDEYTQFMNSALVNGPNAFLPSYEPGVAVDWHYDWLSVHGVYMQILENENGESCQFFGTQLMARTELGLGQGHWRLIWGWGSRDFPEPSGNGYAHKATFLFSCDQELGEHFGAWLRLGNQDEAALVNYDHIYSGGVQINGSLWGREQDAIGIAYGYLTGAEQTAESLSRTQVFETYARFGLNDIFSITADVQYMSDAYVPTASQNDVSGWIAGLRMTAMF